MVEDDSKFELVEHYRMQKQLAEEAEKQAMQDAIAHIHICLDYIMKMGANDSEPVHLRELLELLNQGKIAPAEAKKQADAIVHSKMDYH